MKIICQLPASLWFSATLALVFQSQPCVAADPSTDASTPTAAAGQTAVIEDVVVTARRVEESAQAVPVTISALSASQLQNAAVLETQDLQAHVTGLVITNNSQGGAPTFAIRAATQVNGSAGSIATYVDDRSSTSWSDVNVGTGGSLNGSKFDVGLFVKNLADKRYGSSLSNQLGGLGYAVELYGEPRFAGITVRYHL